jgi:hypothetical protein
MGFRWSLLEGGSMPHLIANLVTDVSPILGVVFLGAVLAYGLR